jgi:O-antigen/teichoic acid export membrane protein
MENGIFGNLRSLRRVNRYAVAALASVVGVFCALLYCVEYAVRVSFSHQSWSLGDVASMSLFFIVAGDVWGLYVWRMLSKRFSPVNRN